MGAADAVQAADPGNDAGKIGPSYLSYTYFNFTII